MTSESKIGLGAFITMKAENEPWLVDRAFVPPADFEFLKGGSSIIIYGETGTGKSAISYSLEHFAELQPKKLVVRWSPLLENNLAFDAVSSSLAIQQFNDILSLCSKILFEKLIQQPDLLKKAPLSAQHFLIWFIRRFYFLKLGNIASIKNTSTKKESIIIGDIKTRSIKDYFKDDIDPIIVAVEFAKALEKIGYSGVWIMVDELKWESLDQRRVIVNSLKAILSMLKLFEISSFSYKMTLPLEFEAELSNTIAVTRDRVMKFRLSWGIPALINIVEKRFSLVVGDPRITLDSIYKTKDICHWLGACGGRSPRGWLEYFRPLVSTFSEIISTEKPRKLTKNEWSDARSRSSLQLQFDSKTNQIRIGAGISRTLSSENAAIFNYLFSNQGRYCTKREIYHNAYLLFSTPKEKYKERISQRADTDEYEDLINTAIYRLRQIIEPIPSDPIFITTKRDLGIRLSTLAFL